MNNNCQNRQRYIPQEIMKTFNAFLISIASLGSLVAAEGRFSKGFSSSTYARDANVPDYLDFFPLSARDYTVSLPGPDFGLYVREAYVPKRPDATDIFRRKAFPPVQHPSFPVGSLANLPPNHRSNAADRHFSDPTPPSKPNEESDSYFPPEGGSSSRTATKHRGRTASFRRNEGEAR